MRALLSPATPVWELVVRVVVVYSAILLLLRLAGKKQVGQMGTAEFVAILLISNAVQNAMNAGDNSLGAGLVLAGVLVAMSALVSYLTFRSRRWELVLQGRPTLLIHKGRILEQGLRREQLNTRELYMLLRKQGVHDVAEIEEAILEADGYVSILKRSELPDRGVRP